MEAVDRSTDGTAAAQDDGRCLWSSRKRLVVSIVLIWHLAAVCAAPLAFPPTSVLWAKMWTVFGPYAQALYLDHGYRFFAPEPGPSHLLSAELSLPDGRSRRVLIPDRERDRPRLYYHRRFMLGEHLNLLLETAPDPEIPEALLRSYARHLLESHDARRATLTLRRHFIPRPRDVLAGQRLDDPTLFRELPLGAFERTARGVRRIQDTPSAEPSPPPDRPPSLTVRPQGKAKGTDAFAAQSPPPTGRVPSNATAPEDRQRHDRAEPISRRLDTPTGR